MTPRLTRAEQQQRNRDRLIASATRLFANHPVRDVSVERIAEEADLSRGAFHSNFSSRDQLLDAVVGHVVGGLQPALDRILDAPGSALERLTAYISAFLDHCAKEPEATSALISVVQHRTTTGAVTYDDLVEAARGGPTALFEEGQRAGEMRPFDTTRMAAVLRRTLDAEALVVARSGEVEPATKELVDLFVRATRADVKEG